MAQSVSDRAFGVAPIARSVIVLDIPIEGEAPGDARGGLFAFSRGFSLIAPTLISKLSVWSKDREVHAVG